MKIKMPPREPSPGLGLVDDPQPTWRGRLAMVAAWLVVMWIIEVVDALFFHGGLDHYGIQPRTFSGLWGVPLAPLLHGGFAHLAANSLPFLVLGGCVALRSVGDFARVTLAAAVGGGLFAWLFGGTNTVHVGASGLIFGYFGFLMLRGWFDRTWSSAALGVVVVVLYGGLMWGVLPPMSSAASNVSWEGHLGGFLGGALAAQRLSRRTTLPL